MTEIACVFIMLKNDNPDHNFKTNSIGAQRKLPQICKLSHHLSSLYSFPFLVSPWCGGALRNAICINTTLSTIMSRIEIFSLDRTPGKTMLKPKKIASKGKDVYSGA